MANFAFETTFDDVLIVCEHRLDRYVTETQVDKILEALDRDLIEKVALDGGCELDDQTEAAFGEIARQIKEKGLL